jgi:pyruvate formate lyase activating enzyme
MSNATERILVGSLQKFSVEDGPGIRTTVFLKGCPLDCKWCHNPELIDPKQQLIKSPNNCIGCGHCIKICPRGAVEMDPEKGIVIDRSKCDVCLVCADQCYAQGLRPVAKPMTVGEILALVEQDKGFYDKTEGGVTFSGGEVLTQPEFVSRLIDEARNRRINVCLDTCGYGNPKALMELAQKENVTDILFDIKSVDDSVHREYTGVSNQLILDNLRMLAGDARTLEKLVIRMPLLKDVNDTEEIIKATGELYREIGVKRVHLLPYHNLGVGKEKNVGGIQEEFEPPTEERLQEIKEYFVHEVNLNVEVMGRE